MTELRELPSYDKPREFYGSFGGVVESVRGQTSSESQHGKNFYQDIKINDGTKVIQVTLINRTPLKDNAVGKDTFFDGSEPDKAVIKLVDGKHGFEAKIYKGCKATIGGHEIPHKSGDSSSPGSESKPSKPYTPANNSKSGGEWAKFGDFNELNAHLRQVQDIACEFAERAKSRLQVDKLSDIPPDVIVSANCIHMACMSSGIKLELAGALTPGLPESDDDIPVLNDDDIPF